MFLFDLFFLRYHLTYSFVYYYSNPTGMIRLPLSYGVADEEKMGPIGYSGRLVFVFI